MRLIRGIARRRWLRRLVVVGGAASALSAYRNRKLAEGEQAFVAAYGDHPSAPPRVAPPSG